MKFHPLPRLLRALLFAALMAGRLQPLPLRPITVAGFSYTCGRYTGMAGYGGLQPKKGRGNGG